MKCLKFFKALFKKTDAFGETVNLQFQKKPKFNTIFGGILTILIYSLTLGLIISLIEKIIKKNEPRTNSSTLYYEYAPTINFLKDDIKFGFGFYTSSIEEFNDPSYFTWSVTKFILDKRNGFSLTKPLVSYDLCKNTPKLFDTAKYNYTDQAIANQMDNFYCLSDYNTSAEGSFSRDYFENLQIEMFKCKNGTAETPSNVTCKTEQEINDKLQGGYFEFYYTNRYIDVTDYVNPVKEFLDVYFITLDPFNARFSDFYLKRVNITSDEGAIFEEKVTQEYVMFDHYRELFDIKSSESLIISFYVNSGKNFLDLYRTYFKLTDMAAVVGGIFNVCIVVGEILTRFVSEVQVKIKILNTLYFFDTPSNEGENILSFEKEWADTENFKAKTDRNKSNLELKREETILSELRNDIHKSTKNIGKVSKVKSSLFCKYYNNLFKEYIFIVFLYLF